MFKTFFKIAWRNMLRRKGFSIINISGLAIGMASAILIFLWIRNEMKMDRAYPKINRIYTLNNRDHFNGALWAWGTTPKILGPTIARDYPEVAAAVRVSGTSFLFTVGDKKITESGDFTDSLFLSTFDFPLIYGNVNALDKPQSIVVTQQFAKVLFGTDQVLGKTVKVDSTDYFTITGVLADLPNNTTFDFNYLMPWSYMKKLGRDDEYWGNNSVNTYLLLKPGVSAAAFNDKIINVTIEHTKHSESPSTTEVFIYPLAKRWLYGKSENGKYVGGRIEMVRMFTIIAIFILLIACINFMNLSTARSEKRAREVGVKKVVGVRKSELIFQFIGEGIFLSMIAGILAMILVMVGLPWFNQLVEKQLTIDFSSFQFWIFFIGFILVTGILAGSYPAFYLSSFRPVNVLKGTFKASHSPVNPRKILVVLQFTFAIALIICTLIVRHQINYAQSRNAGYKADQLVFTNMDGEMRNNYKLIRNELLSSGAALSVTKTMSPITLRYSDGWGWSWTGSTEADDKTDFVRMSSDADFVKTMGVELVAGRDIDIYAHPADSTAMLLNEAAVKVMRLEHPIGTLVQADDETWTVVGVLKDFIYESPFQKVQQMAVMGPAAWFSTIHYRLNPAHGVQENIKTIEEIFKKYNPEYPFNYHFADKAYAEKFDEQQKTGTLAALFAALTILISCLGLFGLATYMAEARVKEIGIRKVLGASVAGITSLLSIDFLKLVIIAFVIAVPLAWWLMNEWLTSFEYRIEISWWVFAIAGLVSVIIALITVAWQAIRAAVANPVKSLRTE